MTNDPATADSGRSTIRQDLSGWTARQRPGRVTLAGRYVRLEPLDPARHGDDLFAARADDAEAWRYTPDGPYPTRAAFQAWLDAKSALEDQIYHAVVDVGTGRAEGRVSFMRMDPRNGVVETGAILFGPRLARTRGATEAIYLQARHVFEDLGYRRLEWKCDAENAPSRRAALRFGFVFEGIFRQHMVTKGRNRDTAWFAMLDHEWPARRAAFEAWLDPANFDAAGRQIRPFSDYA
ncbi:GNAT family protein [Salinarimonas sp.]|uniref:GNAT family N-acetyltransferase n=1 Tax=Salinarimonas sp. TaxID=2766526 RepID=UPI0032D9674A